ncbi:hypothetical protein KCU91_g184, partial [Aureobasidium melanogenum]
MSTNMNPDNIDPAIMGPAIMQSVDMQPANETKIPPIDRAKLAEHAQLGELWTANQNAELNILGAMNACQSHFDDTTFWERDNRCGYHNYQINDPHACLVARQNSINNITANNKMYADMNDFYAEQQKAYDKLHAYNSTKYSRETIQGANRQKAARRGTDTRRANKAKRHEEMVVGIVEELVALRDYSGVLNEQYKKRFDRVAKEVVAAAKVNMTPEITAKLYYGVAPRPKPDSTQAKRETWAAWTFPDFNHNCSPSYNTYNGIDITAISNRIIITIVRCQSAEIADMQQYAIMEGYAAPEAYLNMEGHSELQTEVYNNRNLVVTQDRIFHYDDGFTRTLISVSTSRIPFLIDSTLTIREQYSRESALNILEALNFEQEMLANKKGISTVWRCVGGRYYPLDIKDDRYPTTSPGEQRMVYRCAVAAANALNHRLYMAMDPETNYQEFTIAMTSMAQHNRMMNEL